MGTSSAPGPKAPKAERFAFRLTGEERRLLEKAAALRRTTLTEFVLESCREAAHQELADQTRFLLPPEQMRAFVQALDEPPREIPALRRLFERPTPFGT